MTIEYVDQDATVNCWNCRRCSTIAVFAAWRMKPTCFCVLGVYCLCAFSFFSFRRCSNNKSPQRWCSRIKQQIVLLGNGLHVFFASSGQKLASKGVWVKLWKTKAHANCSLKQKLWQKGSPHTKAEKHNLTLITNGKFQATCWWGNNYSRSRCIFVFDQPVVRCWQIWSSTLGRVLPTTCKLVL